MDAVERAVVEQVVPQGALPEDAVGVDEISRLVDGDGSGAI